MFNPSILTKLNSQGKDLIDEQFGACVADYFSETASSYADLVDYNKNIRDMLMSEYTKKDELFPLIR